MIPTLSVLVTLFVFAYALVEKDMLSSIIALSVAGVSSTLFFLSLQAPDVAFTQLVVNAAIIPVFFVLTLGETRRTDHED